MQISDTQVKLLQRCKKASDDLLIQTILYLKASGATYEELENPHQVGFRLIGMAPLDDDNGEVILEPTLVSISLDETFNTEAAAVHLGRDRKYIQRLRQAGRLQGYAVGREVLYLRKDIFALR